MYFSPIRDKIVGTEYTKTLNTLVPSSPHKVQSFTMFAYCVSCIILSSILVNWFTKVTATNAALKNKIVLLFHALPCTIITIGIITNADWCIVDASKIIKIVGTHFFSNINFVDAKIIVTAANCLTPLNIHDK